MRKLKALRNAEAANVLRGGAGSAIVSQAQTPWLVRLFSHALINVYICADGIKKALECVAAGLGACAHCREEGGKEEEYGQSFRSFSRRWRRYRQPWAPTQHSFQALSQALPRQLCCDEWQRSTCRPGQVDNSRRWLLRTNMAI